jgi:hypothetical protein
MNYTHQGRGGGRKRRRKRGSRAELCSLRSREPPAPPSRAPRHPTTTTTRPVAGGRLVFDGAHATLDAVRDREPARLYRGHDPARDVFDGFHLVISRNEIDPTSCPDSGPRKSWDLCATVHPGPGSKTAGHQHASLAPRGAPSAAWQDRRAALTVRLPMPWADLYAAPC